MEEDIKIRSLTKEDLRNAIADNTYWGFTAKEIPFSKSKANWLLKNNRIAADDICAIIGTEKDKIISFVFLIPDLIRTENGVEKLFWSRRWWVSNKYKNSIIATYTMTTSMNAIQNKAVVKFLGKTVVEFYKKQPFTEFAHRTRCFIIFNFDKELISNKINALKSFKTVTGIIDSVSLSVVSFFNKKKAQKKCKNLNYNYVSAIDDTIWNFIAPYCITDIVPKTKEYINWQIDNSQYTNAPLQNKHVQTCLNNSIASKIYNISFSVIKDNKQIGFISINLRNKEANVRYFICDNSNFELCANALVETLIATKTSKLQTENKALGTYINKTFFSVYTDKRKLYALAHNTMNIDFENAVINDRDGNFA